MADVLSEILPNLKIDLTHHCVIVFPSSNGDDITIYYRDLVAEVSLATSQYFYTVRHRQSLDHVSIGVQTDLSAAWDRVWAVMGHIH
jgi:hypothetical protein